MRRLNKMRNKKIEKEEEEGEEGEGGEEEGEEGGEEEDDGEILLPSHHISPHLISIIRLTPSRTSHLNHLISSRPIPTRLLLSQSSHLLLFPLLSSQSS